MEQSKAMEYESRKASSVVLKLRYIYIYILYNLFIYLRIYVLKSVAKRWMTEVWFQCTHLFFTAFYHSFFFSLFFISYSLVSSFYRNDRNTEEQKYGSEVSDPHNNVYEDFPT
jgi:hypothetical protein